MNNARFTSSSLIFISFVCLITWAWISTVILNRNSDGVIPVTKLSEKVLYVSYLSIMWALGFFVGTVYQCKKVSFYSIFLWVFKIINSSDFYQMIFAFIEIIIWFFFILLMLWFTLIDFLLLNQLCISGINSSWSLYIILFYIAMNSLSPNMILWTFTSIFMGDWYMIFLSCGFWYQGYVGLLKWFGNSFPLFLFSKRMCIKIKSCYFFP